MLLRNLLALSFLLGTFGKEEAENEEFLAFVGKLDGDNTTEVTTSTAESTSGTTQPSTPSKTSDTEETSSTPQESPNSSPQPNHSSGENCTLKETMSGDFVVLEYDDCWEQRALNENHTTFIEHYDVTDKHESEEEENEFGEEYYHIRIDIRDSECYGSHTTSRFVLYMVTLDEESRVVASHQINSDKFNDTREGKIYEETVTGDGETFLTNYLVSYDLKFPTIPPRADAILIDFLNNPEDSWSIDQIDVDVDFMLLTDGGDQPEFYTWHFEHAVAMSCEAWLAGHNVFQFGPRAGLFIVHNVGDVSTLLNETNWLRDWI